MHWQPSQTCKACMLSNGVPPEEVDSEGEDTISSLCACRACVCGFPCCYCFLRRTVAPKAWTLPNQHC